MPDGTLETFMKRYDWSGAAFQASETWGLVGQRRRLLDEIRRLWLAGNNAALANLLLSPDDRRPTSSLT